MVAVFGTELALLGDPDGRRELGVEPPPLDGDLANPVVERLIGQLHQTFEEVAEHVTILPNTCSITSP